MSDQQSPVTPATPAVTPPDAPAITADTIAAAVTAGLQAHEARFESAPKEMTPEERAEYLQIFDPNSDGFVDSFVSAITDPEATVETRAKVLSHFRDGIANQSIRGSQILIQQEVERLRQELAPALQDAATRQAEQYWTQFSTQFPDLVEQRELVDAVSSQLHQAGFKPQSLEEAFTRAATTARAIIAKATGKPVVVSANPTVPSTMPRMTPTNVQGQGVGNAQPPNQAGVASFFLNRKR